MNNHISKTNDLLLSALQQSLAREKEEAAQLFLAEQKLKKEIASQEEKIRQQHLLEKKQQLSLALRILHQQAQKNKEEIFRKEKIAGHTSHLLQLLQQESTAKKKGLNNLEQRINRRLKEWQELQMRNLQQTKSEISQKKSEIEQLKKEERGSKTSLSKALSKLVQESEAQKQQQELAVKKEEQKQQYLRQQQKKDFLSKERQLAESGKQYRQLQEEKENANLHFKLVQEKSLKIEQQIQWLETLEKKVLTTKTQQQENKGNLSNLQKSLQQEQNDHDSWKRQRNRALSAIVEEFNSRKTVIAVQSAKIAAQLSVEEKKKKELLLLLEKDVLRLSSLQVEVAAIEKKKQLQQKIGQTQRNFAAEEVREAEEEIKNKEEKARKLRALIHQLTEISTESSPESSAAVVEFQKEQQRLEKDLKHLLREIKLKNHLLQKLEEIADASQRTFEKQKTAAKHLLKEIAFGKAAHEAKLRKENILLLQEKKSFASLKEREQSLTEAERKEVLQREQEWKTCQEKISHQMKQKRQAYQENLAAQSQLSITVQNLNRALSSTLQQLDKNKALFVDSAEKIIALRKKHQSAVAEEQLLSALKFPILKLSAFKRQFFKPETNGKQAEMLNLESGFLQQISQLKIRLHKDALEEMRALQNCLFQTQRQRTGIASQLQKEQKMQQKNEQNEKLRLSNEQSHFQQQLIQQLEQRKKEICKQSERRTILLEKKMAALARQITLLKKHLQLKEAKLLLQTEAKHRLWQAPLGKITPILAKINEKKEYFSQQAKQTSEQKKELLHVLNNLQQKIKKAEENKKKLEKVFLAKEQAMHDFQKLHREREKILQQEKILQAERRGLRRLIKRPWSQNINSRQRKSSHSRETKVSLAQQRREQRIKRKLRACLQKVQVPQQMKAFLKMMDNLLEKLPRQEIDRFSRSKDFEKYQKMMKKYEVG